VVLVADVDEAGEGHAQGDPQGGPAEGLPDRDHVRVAVEHPEVEGQEQQHQGHETDIHPEHVDKLGSGSFIVK
jgi:hypothetical protein